MIFCDFVDYDEIAHHAGPARRGIAGSLAGIDQVLGTWRRSPPRRPGRTSSSSSPITGRARAPTFRQLTGHTLEDVVREHWAPRSPRR